MAAGTAWGIDTLTALLTNSMSTTFNGNVVGLFLSDITPSRSDSAGTYTPTEAGWAGYNRQSLSYGGPTNDGTVAFVDTATVTFTVTSGGTGSTVYGYFVLTAGGVFLYAERVVTPVSVVDGVPILLDIELGLRNP